MEMILNVIQTVGFPIACCVFLGYYLKKQSDEYREDVRSLTEKHEKSMTEITSKYEAAIARSSASIDRITKVLTALETKIDGKEEKTP